MCSITLPQFQKFALRWGKELSDSICDRKLGDEEIKEKEVRQHPDISKDEKDIYSGDHSDLYSLGLNDLSKGVYAIRPALTLCLNTLATIMI